ncbi:TssQ family T6SS-associated lipoprotein [Alcaligenes endophyticus]|uniref:TssQ family T6SS-associated lipoprotein n=1 Tax=Alcaligenes endophyticus TaxID=1929088 RepID=A0ABT8EKR4_9BURK|nr:TssQ family T6SS-associated lipoprotein [Alcaligenes endophyticus]MCX5590761.1 TssQ family T6SS-associated lipoprotein [Alcaligenes endophyticus]MDN4121876.1 TssQ family T6SS-associated lipoprotein [Alcaligenes endophyticus]
MGFFVATLAACAHKKPQPEPEPAPRYSAAEQALLAQLRNDYEQGNYEEIVRSLENNQLLQQGGEAFQTQAYRYQAFSYCSLEQAPACRNSFRALLQIDPGHSLSPAEYTHPIWGPIFAEESLKVRSSQIRIR